MSSEAGVTDSRYSVLITRSEETAIFSGTDCRYRLILAVAAIALVAGCAARQSQDSLTGATAQRLVSFGIDDMVAKLPDDHFTEYVGQRVRLNSHFLADDTLQAYADRRLQIELQRRFDIESVPPGDDADFIVNVFYTSLGTNRDTKGFYLPLGYVPGLDEGTRIDLLTLEQFHGVAEMYFFVGPTGTEKRGAVIQARTRTDALGLPIITIPLVDVEPD